MSGELQPLDQQFPIVDGQGRPTLYFIKWAQQRQIDIGGAITPQYLTDHSLVEGSGIQFTPDGDINNSPTIAADVQEILDQITVTRGSVLYRGIGGWAALAPGAAGTFLKTQGAGADPVWAAAGGGGGTGTPTIRASTITSSSNNSYVIAWPAGTIAGDVVIIFGGHGFGFNRPLNWAELDNSQGSNWNGFTIAKLMTAADILAGSVTVTTAGAFNGVISAITIVGTTMNGVRAIKTKRDGVIVTASDVSVVDGAIANTDLVLGFASNRNASNNTISNFTALQTVNAASASGILAKFTGTFNALGVTESAAYSVGGSGYYTSAVALRGV